MERPIVFVLGAPGAGKGTQCSLLATRYNCRHLSAGDLLREEQIRPGSEHAALIDYYIREGLIVPAEITVQLLKRRMEEDKKAAFFLIDGFPRAVEQWEAFNAIVKPQHVSLLFIEGEDKELISRCLSRSQTSGRTDDNEESLRKRFVVFHKFTEEVKPIFSSSGTLREVDGLGDKETVHLRVVDALRSLGCPL